MVTRIVQSTEFVTLQGYTFKLGVRGFEATVPKIRMKKKEEYRRKRGEVFGDI